MEFEAVAALIFDVLDGLAANGPVEAGVKARVPALCNRFPFYVGL